MRSTRMTLYNGRACIMIISGNVLRRLRVVVVCITKIIFSSDRPGMSDIGSAALVGPFCVGSRSLLEAQTYRGY